MQYRAIDENTLRIEINKALNKSQKADKQISIVEH